MKPAAIFFLMALALPATAQAASFDCAKASSPREKTICTTPELSKADEEIAAGYEAAMSKLSPEGAARFRDGQRSWLGFLGKACPAGSADCLASFMMDRVEFLSGAVAQEGGNVFFAWDGWHFIAPAREGEEELPGANDMRYRQQLHYAIDAPDSDGERAFNAQVAKEEKNLWNGFDGETRMWASFTLNMATPDLVSLDMMEWQYPLGAAHGFGASVHVNFRLDEGRPLRADDIFASKGWEAALSEAILKELHASAGKDGAIYFDGYEETVAETVANPEHWVLTGESLGVNFSVYSIGPYAIGERTPAVPWTALSSFIAKDAPLGR